MTITQTYSLRETSRDGGDDRTPERPAAGGPTAEPRAESSFGRQLKLRVAADLSGPELARCHARLQRKGALVTGWYAASFVAILLATGWWTGIAACVSLGLSIVAVGVNIQHDANHNAFFAPKGSRRLSRGNRLAGLSLNALGGSAHRWIDGHVHLHHSSPNVVGRDFDIDLGPLGRLAPEQPRRPWHAYQHLYLWFLYAFTVVGIFAGDITGTVGDVRKGDRHGRRPPPRIYLGVVVTKVLFLGVMVGLPLLRHPAWAVAAGAALVLGLSGLLLGVIFQLAHAVEDTSFRLAEDKAPVRWHEWQVLTSVDFCQSGRPSARLLTWYAGGLNYQTEHHLFPNLPHTAYPLIAPGVAATCAEFGIRYKVHPTLRQALRSHYRHARALGRPGS